MLDLAGDTNITIAKRSQDLRWTKALDQTLTKKGAKTSRKMKFILMLVSQLLNKSLMEEVSISSDEELELTLQFEDDEDSEEFSIEEDSEFTEEESDYETEEFEEEEEEDSGEDYEDSVEIDEWIKF